VAWGNSASMSPARHQESCPAETWRAPRRSAPPTAQAWTVSRSSVTSLPSGSQMQRACSYHMIQRDCATSSSPVVRQSSLNSGLVALRQKAAATEAALQDLARLAAGDVLVVHGTGQLAQIGAVGGFMGHVLVILDSPLEIGYNSWQGEELRSVLPDDCCQWPLWQIPTMECTSGVPGLHVTSQLAYVEEPTGSFVLLGEVRDSPQGPDFTEYEDAAVEFWRAPYKLRQSFRPDVMSKVVGDMKQCEASWSFYTALRAVLRSAHVDGSGTSESERLWILQELQECWESDPICTSVVIELWQRYLCELALHSGGAHALAAAELVLRWMPLKADRALPGDLLGTMLRCGFTMLEDRPSRLPRR